MGTESGEMIPHSGHIDQDFHTLLAGFHIRLADLHRSLDALCSMRSRITRPRTPITQPTSTRGRSAVHTETLPAFRATEKLHANVRQEGLPTIDETTDKLLRELRGSPTDLAKLVERIHRRGRRVVPISANAIARWNKDDPDSWERVRGWLTRRGVQIIVD